MPGAGKSSCLKYLQTVLDVQTCDLDYHIEKLTGISIHQYWDWYGEPSFRSLERKVLIQILDSDDSIIAMGGGTPCFFNNLSLIKERSLCIYIKADPDKIVGFTDFSNRPNFSHSVSFVDQLNSLLERRKPFYERADYLIENDYIELNWMNTVKEICIKDLNIKEIKNGK